MGLIDSMNRAVKGTQNWLRGKRGESDIPKEEPLPQREPYMGVEVADATPPEPDTSRYRHVSVPLFPIENPMMRKLLGVGYTLGQGQTHNIGNNAMKREADRIAEFHGFNNKMRRRLRTKIKRRAEELRSGQATLSPVVREGMRRVAAEVMS